MMKDICLTMMRVQNRITSLKQQLPILSCSNFCLLLNAQEVKEWLINQDGVLVDGKDLSPTNRSIAFVDWTFSNRLFVCR
jgi:hypothetical protein